MSDKPSAPRGRGRVQAIIEAVRRQREAQAGAAAEAGAARLPSPTEMEENRQQVAKMEAEVEKVTEQAEQMTVEKSETVESEKEPKCKPDPVVKKGSGGSTLNLSSNYIRLIYNPDFGIYEYSLSFEPPVDTNQMRHALLKEHAQVLPVKMVLGNKVLLPVKQPDLELTSSLPETGEKVMVKLTYVGQKDVGDRECLQLYNGIIRRILRAINLVDYQKGTTTQFYDPKKSKTLPQHNLAVWPGYVLGLEEFEGGVLLRCDSSNRIMRTQSCLDIIADIHRKNPATAR